VMTPTPAVPGVYLSEVQGQVSGSIEPYTPPGGVAVINVGAYIRWTYAGRIYESRSNWLVYGRPIYLPLLLMTARLAESRSP
jgi:hypothetical protein